MEKRHITHKETSHSQTYRTRISLSLVILITLAACAPIFFIPNEARFAFVVSVLPVYVGIILCLFSIKYVIEGSTLKVYYFFGIHQDINIYSIQRMERSRCLLSSPAASLKRLAIYYGEVNTIYISPRNQEDFIKTINAIKEKQ